MAKPNSYLLDFKICKLIDKSFSAIDPCNLTDYGV